MEQQRAINALESFLALSKSANSPRAAADLVTQATSHPQTYVFAELLHTPNIHALQTSPEYGNHYKLLEIFAWGTWADYQSTPGLPTLSAQQKQKLRLLSLLPLAGDQKNLTYTSLQTALSLPSPQSLESLITTAIYSSLITGTLDPAHRVVNITSVAPLRDLAPGSIPTLTATLDQWGKQCSSMLSDLQSQIADVKKNAKLKGEQQARVQKLLDEKIAEAEAKESSSRPKRSAGALGSLADVDDEEEGGDAMDVDNDGRRGSTRTSKRGGFGMMGRFG